MQRELKIQLKNTFFKFQNLSVQFATFKQVWMFNDWTYIQLKIKLVQMVHYTIRFKSFLIKKT